MKIKKKYICKEYNCFKLVYHKDTRCCICAELYKKYPSRKGYQNSQYKDGRSLQKYYCIDCKKEIGWQTWHEGTKRCRSCSCINRYKNSQNHPMYGKKRSDMSLRIGELNFNWSNNASYERYPSKFNNILKETIRQRDNYTCQLCEIHQDDYYRNLDVHHIDYNKNNLDLNNLISLCHSCHMTTNGSRNYWTGYFKKL